MRAGGALLMAEGPDYATPEGLYFSPLGDLAPAKPDGEVIAHAFRPTISPDGAKHPVTRGLTGGDASPPAWGPWFRQISAEVTGGVNILSGAENRPLLDSFARRQGTGGPAAERPDVALGARL